MDKQQDADLEKGYETVEDPLFFDDDERAPLFDTDDEDLFDERVYGDELDYEPEGAFLD